METRDFHIIAETGIHARPATLLVQAASKFNADVTVSADGDDEKEAIEALADTMKKEGLSD